MRSLRIGIDGRAFASPAAGVRRYLEGLVPALLDLEDAAEIVALGGGSGIPAGLARVEAPAHPATNAGWMLVGLPRTAAKAGVDLIHAPAYTAPFWSPVPVVLTIHDISYERHPEWYPYRRDRIRRAFYRRSARSAARILTDSEFSAGEIVAAYGIARESITVAPLGVSPAFSPADPSLPCELPSRVTVPYLLHVGDLHERRNLMVVVDALIESRRHFGVLPALSLVLAGIDRGVADALCAVVREADAPDAVLPLGVVDEEQLHRLYRCATALVYPSRYEGFGFPVLEAMACGTPVIASRAASIPEILGDAGVLLDPHDGAAWREAIVKVVNDEPLRATMRAAGLARASQFTWERTARATMGVYRQVAGR